MLKAIHAQEDPAARTPEGRTSLSDVERDEAGRCRRVLVQPEVERGRSPLVSNSTLRAGIFRAPIRPPSYPSAWLRPRRARFRFARPDHCSSTTSIRLNFRVARDSGGAVMASLALAEGCLSLWFNR
jgi:hypothetical protein